MLGIDAISQFPTCLRRLFVIHLYDSELNGVDHINHSLSVFMSGKNTESRQVAMFYVPPYIYRKDEVALMLGLE